jgi:CxxC motif-containing protein
MKRNLICISCPIGCHITVEGSDGNYTVTGNTCKNGEKYGIEEVTNPQRVVPSTVVIKGAMISRLPVKTADTIPKAKIFDCMKALEDVVVTAPVKMGDVIVPNVCGTGVDVVATKTMPAV